jgi:septin family protein
MPLDTITIQNKITTIPALSFSSVTLAFITHNLIYEIYRREILSELYIGKLSDASGEDEDNTGMHESSELEASAHSDEKQVYGTEMIKYPMMDMSLKLQTLIYTSVTLRVLLK